MRARRIKVVLRSVTLWCAASLCFSAFQLSRVSALRVPGAGMEPTLVSGQLVIVTGLFPDSAPADVGDVVVVEVASLDDARLFKRVVGVGGDSVSIVDKQLFRNGVAVSEPYVIFLDDRTYVAGDDPLNVQRDQLKALEIPSEAVFVMGDNRDHSHDSRFFGTVPLSSVLGRVR